MSETFADVVYWLVFLIFLPLILQALDLQALLEPVTTLFNKVFAFLPNLISAAAIVVIGWFIARIVQRSSRASWPARAWIGLSEKWGLAASLGKQKLSGVLGLVVYFVILVPVLISRPRRASARRHHQTRQRHARPKSWRALPNIIGAADRRAAGRGDR